MSLRSRAHIVVLVGAMVVVAVVAALVAIHISTIALDETLYKQSAVRYTSGLPDTLLHDLTARGTARLYSLLLAPFFAAFDGDVAVRCGRAFTAILFAATAIPVYLLAREVIRSRWGAVAAALGAITAPWLTLATTMFSEGLSLLLFAWTLVLIVRALRRPTWWRDALVVVALGALLCTRVQLGALVAAWLIVVVVWQVRAAHDLRLSGWDVGFVVRRLLRHHPVTSAIAAVGLAELLKLMADGTLHYRIQVVFGTYSEIQDRTVLPSDTGLAALFEVLAYSVGVGLVPAILALAWLGGALAGRLGREHLDIALLGTILLGVLFAVTLTAQGGYLGVNSEERYYVYLLPLLWIGAIAAWEDRRVSRAWMAAAAGGLVLLAATVDLGQVQLDYNRFFLAPVAATVKQLSPRITAQLQDLLGLGFVASRRDLLMYASLVVGGLTVLLVRSRGPRWALAALAVVVQLGITVYALQGRRGVLSTAPAPASVDFHRLGWVDRATPGRPPVAWLDNQLRIPAFPAQQQTILFYNDEITSVLKIPQQMLSPLATPLDALPVALMAPAGAVIPPAPAGWFVAMRDSPILQLGGRVVATGYHDLFELRHVTARDRVTWIAESLADDGIVSVQRPARMLARTGTAATLRMMAPTPAPSSVILQADGHRRLVRFGPQAPGREVRVRLCSKHDVVPVMLRASRTTRLADNREAAAVLLGVHVTPIRCP
jgi:hypothetical protein